MLGAPSPSSADLMPWCEHSEDGFSCVEYVRNHDGDTFTINIAGTHPLFGREITVRVKGIDAPEMDAQGHCEKSAARRAKEFTENFLKRASRIDLQNVGRDKYFRILADVTVDGESLADGLLRANLAVEYDGRRRPRVDWCSK